MATIVCLKLINHTHKYASFLPVNGFKVPNWLLPDHFNQGWVHGTDKMIRYFIPLDRSVHVPPLAMIEVEEIKERSDARITTGEVEEREN